MEPLLRSNTATPNSGSANPFGGFYSKLTQTVKLIDEFIFKKGQTEQTVKVRELRPNVLNFVFSSSANKPENVREARINNIPVNLSLMEKVADKFLSMGYDHEKINSIKTALEQYRKDPTEDSETTLCSTLELAADSFKDDPWIPMLLKGFKIALSGTDFLGTPYDTPEMSGIQYLNMVTTQIYLGSTYSLGIECKSGNDRTATGLAIALAQHEYIAKNGRPFDYKGNDQEFKNFQVHFTDNINRFAKNNVIISRGYHENGQVIEGVAKLHLGPNLRFWHRIRFLRKLPTFSQVCQLAKKANRCQNHQIGSTKRVLQLPQY